VHPNLMVQRCSNPVTVAAEENVYPMIPAGGSYRDIMMGEADLAAKARGKRAATYENWLFLTNYDII